RLRDTHDTPRRLYPRESVKASPHVLGSDPHDAKPDLRYLLSKKRENLRDHELARINVRRGAHIANKTDNGIITRADVSCHPSINSKREHLRAICKLRIVRYHIRPIRIRDETDEMKLPPD